MPAGAGFFWNQDQGLEPGPGAGQKGQRVAGEGGLLKLLNLLKRFRRQQQPGPRPGQRGAGEGGYGGALESRFFSKQTEFSPTETRFV